jgi:hypothetical protein
MADVVAELKWHVDTTEVEDIDAHRLTLVRRLRQTAESYPVVTLQMDAPVARLIAADLEELTMLRVVPPTGETG